MIVFIGGVDYVAFDEVIDLQVGATGFIYNVTIRHNPAAEPIETFNVIMSFMLGGTLIVTHNTAIIQILNNHGKRFLIVLTILIFI